MGMNLLNIRTQSHRMLSKCPGYHSFEPSCSTVRLLSVCFIQGITKQGRVHIARESCAIKSFSAITSLHTCSCCSSRDLTCWTTKSKNIDNPFIVCTYRAETSRMDLLGSLSRDFIYGAVAVPSSLMERITESRTVWGEKRMVETLIIATLMLTMQR